MELIYSQYQENKIKTFCSFLHCRKRYWFTYLKESPQGIRKFLDMWVQDVRLHFGLELVLHYSCMDGSGEGAGPKLFTPAGCGLRSYQQWDQSGPSAGKSPSSWEGHYSHGVYSWAMGAEPTKFLQQVQENSQFVFFHHRARLPSCVPASAKRGNTAVLLQGLTWNVSAQSWCQVRKGASKRDMQWTSCWAGLMGSSKSCG